MNRRTFEDVKVNNKKTILEKKNVFVNENIDPDNHNGAHHYNQSKEQIESKYEFLNKRANNLIKNNKRISSNPQPIKSKKVLSNSLLVFLILSLFVGGVYLLSTKFLTAKITLVSKNKTFDIKNQKFTASNNNSTSVPFEIMIVSDSEYRNVVLTNSKEISQNAKGSITIYNEYSSKPVRLVSGTFLTDENGKSYKLDNSVSIPGFTLDKTKKIIPGQIVTGISSFLPGEMYNGNPKLFKFTSYKSTDKYNKIYANAKTPMEGGMVGLVYLLADTEKEEILSKTRDLKDKLTRKLSAQVPDSYILYPNATSFKYEIINSQFSKNPNAKIELKGTISAMLLKEAELSRILIERLLPSITDFEKSEIEKPDLSILLFNFENGETVVSKEIDNITFNLSGSLYLSWKPEIENIKNTLVGKSKYEVPNFFKTDPGILSAKVVIIPFWSKYLPKNTKNINIIVE